LTAATVLQILIPLVIILLAFAAFAGERESGTLRQVLSVGASRPQLAVGKILGVSLALGLILVPAAILGAAALSLSSETASFAANLSRFALLVAVYLVYFAIFLTVSLFVSAVAPSSRFALIVLLAFWSVNLILPRVAADAGKAFYPTPSALEFRAAVARDMREGIDGHNPYDARGEELKQKLLRQYNVKTIEELPVNFEGVALQESEEYGNLVYERRYGDLWTAYENQNRLHTLAGIFAPLAAVRAVSMSLAGSDWQHHRHFAESAEQYRRMLVKRMNDEVTYNSHSRDYEKNVRGRELYEQIPDFRYQPPAPAFAVGSQILAFGLLGAWLAAGFFALGWALKKMSVEAKDF
jgi:ABC-2 type transport system permease protein